MATKMTKKKGKAARGTFVAKGLMTSVLGVIGVSWFFLMVTTLLLLLLPHVLVNTYTVTKLAHLMFAPEEVSWRGLQLQVDSHSLLRKGISLRLDKLQVDRPEVSAKVQQLEAYGIVNLNPWAPLVSELGPATVTSPNMIVHASPAEASSSVWEEESISEQLRTLLRAVNALTQVRVKDVRVEDATIVVEANPKKGGRDVSAHGELLYEAQSEGVHGRGESHLQFKLSQVVGLPLQSLEGLGSLALAVSPGAPPTAGALAVYGDFGARGRGELNLQLTASPTGGPARLQGDLSYGMGGAKGRKRSKMRAQLHGKVGTREAELTLTSQAAGGVPFLQRLQAEKCQINASWGESFDEDAAASFDCRGRGERLELVDEMMLRRFLPVSFGFNVGGSAKLLGGRQAKALSLDVEGSLERINNPLFELTAKGGVMGSIPLVTKGEVSLKSTYAISSRIKKFEQLVIDLVGTHWEVPAPFNQMAGAVACNATGTFNTARQEGVIPIACGVDLASEGQSLQLNADGKIVLQSVGKRIEPMVELDIKVERFDFQLPRLELGKRLPQLTTDKRVVAQHSKRAPSSAAGGLAYRIHVRSNRPDAIRIHSNLIKIPLPLTINATLADDRPMEGDIVIADYSMEVLRRQMKVERLTIKLHNDPKQQTLAGRVYFKHNIYNIYLKIYGNVAEPIYTFSSEPPLPEQDILALVLFGKLPDALDSEKLRSVDDARSALADRAISLLSMYFLAATPVESIGYNPQTDMFTASIKLREGLSVTLGAGADNKSQVGIQKRIGRNLTIESKLVRDEATEESKGVAMLKWGIRY